LIKRRGGHQQVVDDVRSAGRGPFKDPAGSGIDGSARADMPSFWRPNPDVIQCSYRN